MSKTSYAPLPGSVAWKTIQFLTTNPDEALTADDVAAKFDCSTRGVHTLLSQAVAVGALTRTEDLESGDLVYKIGKGVPEIVADPGAAPSLRAAFAPPRPRRRVRAPFKLELDAVVIEDGVPIKASTPQNDWEALLNRMKPGQSCVFPASAMSSLQKLRAQVKKAGTGEVAVRRESDEQVRFWRVR